jgi:Na+/pantothenate symporter
LFRGTGEDYFLASRTIGPFVLLMTLFGTNMTAFTMLGASGQAYREGIIVFALMGSSSALAIPLVIYFVGTRLWWLGKREGYLTQVQFFRERYQSDLLGLMLFIVLVSLMLPYVLIGVKGGGDALQAITGGAEEGLASWIGSLLICGVVFVYVTYGGMRSTAWANTFQTLVFMIVGGVRVRWRLCARPILPCSRSETIGPLITGCSPSFFFPSRSEPFLISSVTGCRRARLGRFDTASSSIHSASRRSGFRAWYSAR